MIDGPKVSMKLISIGIGKGNRMHEDQFRLVGLKFRTDQPTGFAHPDTHPFIIAEAGFRICAQRINDQAVIKIIGPVGQGISGNIMLGEQIIQFTHSLAVARYSDIPEIIIRMKFDAGNGLDAGFKAGLYEIGYPCGVVDIG